jgi:hypothetical protein
MVDIRTLKYVRIWLTDNRNGSDSGSFASSFVSAVECSKVSQLKITKRPYCESKTS